MSWMVSRIFGDNGLITRPDRINDFTMDFRLKETLIAITLMMGLGSPTMAEDFVLRFGPNTLRIGRNGIDIQVPQGSLQYRRESRSQGQEYPVYRPRPSSPPPPVADVTPPKSPFWSPPPVAAVPPQTPKSPPAAVPPPKSPFWSPPPLAAVPPHEPKSPPPPAAVPPQQPKSPPPLATVPPPKSPPEESPPPSQIDPPAPLPEPGHIPPTSKYFGPQSKEKSRPYIQQ
jgi:hypothetical protein